MKNIQWNKTVVIGIIFLFFGTGMANVFVEDLVIDVAASPVYHGWNYSKEININHFKVEANLTDFPVLINLPSDTNLSTYAQPDGDDIVFTDAQGNKLSHEIELYESTTGHLVAWVKVPSLSCKSDTRLYLYYGNDTSGNQQDQTGTWNSDYLMVHHMNETGNIVDSTINGLNAVNTGTTAEPNGKMNGCRYFNSNTDVYNFGNPSALNPGLSSWTISLWTKIVYEDQNYIIDKGSYSAKLGFLLEMHNDVSYGFSYFWVGDGVDTASRYWDSSWSDGNWHYITIVINRDSNQIDLYLDGALHNGGGQGDLTSIGNITTLSDFSLRGGTNGRHDEFTISKTVRNASWIKTCYNNQNDPARFLNLDTSPEVIPVDDPYSPIRKYFTTQKILWSFDDYWINDPGYPYPPHKGFGGLSQRIINYGGYVQINSIFIPDWIGHQYGHVVRNYTVVPEFSIYAPLFSQYNINKSLAFFNSNHITVGAHDWNGSTNHNTATLDYAYEIINFTLWNWYNNYHIQPRFWLGNGGSGNYNISLALKRFSDTYWPVYAESFTLLNDATGEFPDGRSPAVECLGKSYDPEFGLSFGTPCTTLQCAQTEYTNYALDRDILFIKGHPGILNNTGQENNLTLWQQWIDWIYTEHELLNINHTEAIAYKYEERTNFTVIRNNAKNYTIDLTDCKFNHTMYLTSPDNDGSRWMLYDNSGAFIGYIIRAGFLPLEKDHSYYLTAEGNSPPVFGTSTPSNSSINNPLSLSWNIPINDPNGNRFSWNIQCSNGQNKSGTNDIDGTKSLALSGLEYSTPYTVWVNATDPTPIGSGNWTNRSYKFTTKANTPPVYSTPSPANGSTGNPLTLSWSISITDEEHNFNWTIQCSNGQKTNGSYATNGTKSLSLTGLKYSTTYTVWVNATDPAPAGSGLYNHGWFTFTTKANTPPLYGTPSPANGSTQNPLTLSWSIPIIDEEHNFNWTIECSNGQKSGLKTGETNGTKSLSLTGLKYSTTYTVWVNATDPASAGGSGLYNYGLFTFTTKASGGGGGDGGGTTQNQKPIADLSAGEPYKGYANAEIIFDGSRSSDPDGTITKWSWNFGDNTSGTGKTVTHTYLKAGTYTVTLTVTDNESATNFDTTTCVITPQNRQPTTPIITGPTKGTKNTIYTYTAVSTDADNDTIKYTFNWGEPVSQPQSSGFLPNGTSYTANHSWATAGRYEVTVTATDNHTTSSSKITVYIDAEQTGDIGYLLDNNGDGIYDAFYSDVSKQITTVQKKDGSYNIDSDGDGDWDYTFDAIKGLTSYQPPKTNGIDALLIIGVIVVVVICASIVAFVWKRKRSV
jgi:hypothetical protein